MKKVTWAFFPHKYLFSLVSIKPLTDIYNVHTGVLHRKIATGSPYNNVQIREVEQKKCSPFVFSFRFQKKQDIQKL